MVAFHYSRKPPATIGTNRRLKNVIAYKKYGTAPPQRVHRSGISMSDQRKLEETAAMADALLKRFK
jgi:hypothetical protein